VIGSGYLLTATPGTPVLTGSVSIQYLSNDVSVAGASENDLSIYFYDGSEWRELATTRSSEFNLVTAPSAGTGIYALMASIKIALYGPGWNNIAYPVPETRLITDALRSISGTYTTLYSYVPTNTVNDWRLYDVTIPPQFDALVNTLRVLEYGHGYWINVTQTITLHLTPKTQTSVYLPAPPATYYGLALAAEDFTPEAGMSVTAWIGGQLCGGGYTTLLDDGQVGYVIHVSAEAGAAECGASGRSITFAIGGKAMATAAVWSDAQMWRLDLSPAWHKVYLPVIGR
jgi:hypothetical protein